MRPRRPHAHITQLFPSLCGNTSLGFFSYVFGYSQPSVYFLSNPETQPSSFTGVIKIHQEDERTPRNGYLTPATRQQTLKNPTQDNLQDRFLVISGAKLVLLPSNRPVPQPKTLFRWYFPCFQTIRQQKAPGHIQTHVTHKPHELLPTELRSHPVKVILNLHSSSSSSSSSASWACDLK